MKRAGREGHGEKKNKDKPKMSVPIHNLVPCVHSSFLSFFLSLLLVIIPSFTTTHALSPPALAGAHDVVGRVDVGVRAVHRLDGGARLCAVVVDCFGRSRVSSLVKVESRESSVRKTHELSARTRSCRRTRGSAATPCGSPGR